MNSQYIRKVFSRFKPKSVAAPSAAGGDDSTDEESICRECRQVDWDSLADQGEHFQQEPMPLLVRSLWTNHEELATSPCRICRILSIVKPQSLDSIKCVVGARSFLDFQGAYAMPFPEPDCKTTALYVCPANIRVYKDFWNDKCLAVIRRDSLDSGSRTISPKLIDFDWFKHLAKSCEESSEDLCGRSSLEQISGLKVIEALSRTVIEAPAECRYVALSYVWGKQPEVTQTATSHVQKFPPLIEDALSVTIAMGFK